MRIVGNYTLNIQTLITFDPGIKTLDDLAAVKCDVVTLGQYLQPTPKHLPVARFVHPDEFKAYKEYALGKGFRFVESGPLVRSSYHAEKHIF